VSEIPVYPKGVKRLLYCIFSVFTLIGLLLVGLVLFDPAWVQEEDSYVDISESPTGIYYMNYDIASLDPSGESEKIRLGYELFVNTPKYLGPKSDQAYSGNTLSCNNCHLLAGTKPYAAPLIGIVNRFPQYRGREDKVGTIEERINGCFERSMNGRMLSEDSEEMEAYVAYLTWLSRYAPRDGKIEGQGFLSIKIPDRPVDLEKGAAIFHTICAECHGVNGQGVKELDAFVYTYPPLWGEDSFNNGAGMNRVITAAQFIKGNMPYGVTYVNPRLTDEEAYDVAGYINQRSRPTKQNLEADFPDLKRKPVSTPYPPYADPFPQSQHQLGPFQEIMAYYKKEYDLVKRK
jgi:thiosulfate dehydrogenase